MGSRLRAIIDRLRADLRQHPGVWIGLAIALVTLYIIWRMAHNNQQSTVTPNLTGNGALSPVGTDTSTGSASAGGVLPTPPSALPPPPLPPIPMPINIGAGSGSAPAASPPTEGLFPRPPNETVAGADQSSLLAQLRAIPGKIAAIIMGPVPNGPVPSANGGMPGGWTPQSLPHATSLLPLDLAAQANLTRALPVASQPEPDPNGVQSVLTHAQPVQATPSSASLTSVPAHQVAPTHYSLHVLG